MGFVIYICEFWRDVLFISEDIYIINSTDRME